ncbi:MAG: nickel-dependent lactate racemase [candidate division Zixibacteria bacterium]|nr:nickel-dependent lactate racemase [candidate division Zixibacteria bacterium]
MSQQFKIPYGNSYQTLEIPSGLTVSQRGTKTDKEHQALDIEKKIEESDLINFLSDSDNLLIIINDHTRFTPSGEILGCLKGYLKKINKIELLIATGTHRASTDSELKGLLGPVYNDLTPVARSNDCLDKDKHYLAGTISSGIPIYLDKSVDQFDNILVIGSVEPHFFAGFTGGRKGIFPGVALKDSIIANHVKAIDRDVQPLELDNPLHRDMDEVMDILHDKNIYSIQTVHNHNRSVVGLFTGDLRGSFNRAVKLAQNIYTKTVEEQFDIVIALVSPPLDIDLYQIQKSFENTKFAVKPGGVCILVSECREGVGPDDWLKLSSKYGSSNEVLNHAQDAQIFGFHKLYRPARFMERSRIFVVSDVEDYYVKSVFLTPKKNIQSAVDDAVKLSPPDPSILIVYDAGQNVIQVNSKKDLPYKSS